MNKNKVLNKFNITERELRILLGMNNHPFPELKRFIANPEDYLENRQTKDLLKKVKSKFEDLKEVPKINKSLYDQYNKDGKRGSYEKPHNSRREKLSICVLYYLLGHKKYLNTIEKYLNAICDEHTWVMPFHRGRIIDLYSADTAFILAEIIFILKDKINSKIYTKVEKTINKRIFIPYLDKNIKHRWYKNNDNWNAVCNSEIASAFLLIEDNNARKARAIKKALGGLEVYINKSFKDDGSTEEGILYWNYGISMFVIFSEMLRASSKNKIDLLKINKVKKIAQYPSQIQLSLKAFATFSDTSETGAIFHPGIIQRLSQMTGEKSLLGLISKPSELDWFGINTMLRRILWWNGKITNSVELGDSTLLDVGIARLIGKGSSVSLITKAGNNGENHNHNDVGSFIINIFGENFVTDPGAGLYSKGYHDYSNSARYKNIFTNSFGHSVPRIDNTLQSAGKKFSGKILSVKKINSTKYVSIEMSGAYNIPKLKKLIRNISIKDNKVILEDKYLFSGNSLEIEEALITWLNVVVRKNIAIISNKNHKLLLTIQEPQNVKFNLKKLTKESKENEKSKVLKRISLTIPKTENNKVNIKIDMEVK